ncbi:MAG: hypothetical protein N3C62_05900 [Synergistetes bacterium]|nr:hypothetical protein [Synergistota bacterium]MCX8128250.1 hypothetical protein [Synergistota bacterium]MDW8192697.1 hypothetical protein [Synergistota bacterium]
MRKGFLWAFIASLAFGSAYLYYSGFLEDIFSPSSMPHASISAERVTVLAEKDIDALIETLREFPKSEDYLKSIKPESLELKDPFLLVTDFSTNKLEVKVNPQSGLVVEIPPPIRLEGIVDVGSKKIAVLQIGDEKGVVLAQGEKRGDVKVIKIEKGKVVISWKNQLKFLEFEESR